MHILLEGIREGLDWQYNVPNTTREVAAVCQRSSTGVGGIRYKNFMYADIYAKTVATDDTYIPSFQAGDFSRLFTLIFTSVTQKLLFPTTLVLGLSVRGSMS